MRIITESYNNYDLPINATLPFLKSYSGVCSSGYFEEDGVVLPYIIRHKFILKWIQIDNNPYGASDLVGQLVFLNKVVDYVKKNINVSHIITTNMVVCDVHPDDAIACKWGTYMIDLSKSADELFSNIHAKHRNVIRKAISNNMQILYGSKYKAEVIALIKDTYERQGKTSSFNFKSAMRFDALGDHIEYWLVRDSNGVNHGSAVFLWYPNQCCFYLHGGSLEKTAAGSMNLLIWTAMQVMKERGVRYFDFVGARVNPQPGSKLEGIQRFKSRFGATMKVGWMYKVIINKPYYCLYKLVLNIHSLLHGNGVYKDNIDQELDNKE